MDDAEWYTSDSYTQNVVEEEQDVSEEEMESQQITSSANYEFNSQSINYIIIIENN